MPFHKYYKILGIFPRQICNRYISNPRTYNFFFIFILYDSLKAFIYCDLYVHLSGRPSVRLLFSTSSLIRYSSSTADENSRIFHGIFSTCYKTVPHIPFFLTEWLWVGAPRAKHMAVCSIWCAFLKVVLVFFWPADILNL